MLRQVRRILILIFGVSVLLVGLAMTVLPGPAFIVIPLGLGILATEFIWARRLLDRVKEAAEKGAEKINLRSLFSRKPRPR
jgi:tellurite resistance protein TerC